jgi:hypothetical protein
MLHCIAEHWQEGLVVLGVIKHGLRVELASSEVGDPLDDLSYTVVQLKPFLAAGAKAIEAVQRAGGSLCVCVSIWTCHRMCVCVCVCRSVITRPWSMG